MIGFWIVNLLIPEEPPTFLVKAQVGIWTFNRAAFYAKSESGIQAGQCAITYAMEHPVSMDNGAAACDAALDEITPLLLGASYYPALASP